MYNYVYIIADVNCFFFNVVVTGVICFYFRDDHAVLIDVREERRWS